MTETMVRKPQEEAVKLIHGAFSQARTYADAYNLWQYFAGYMDGLRAQQMPCEPKTGCENGR